MLGGDYGIPPAPNIPSDLLLDTGCSKRIEHLIKDKCLLSSLQTLPSRMKLVGIGQGSVSSIGYWPELQTWCHYLASAPANILS
jgi:hypothetical protein